MFAPLVSIIIPIYKVEQYLRRCLDSIISQTYSNLEIILVDDGSPDRCSQICDEYAEKDKRITVVHKENGGLSDARNAGLDICKGDYIYFVDSDDELPLNSIYSLIAKLKEYPDAEIIIGDIKSVPFDPINYSSRNFNTVNYINNNIWIRKNFFRFFNRIPVNAVCKLISKEFIKKNHLYFKKGLIHEDELWMFYVVKKLRILVFAHTTAYIRHVTPNSITTSTDYAKKNKAWGEILKEIFGNISSPTWNEQFFTYTKFWMSFYSSKHNKQLYDESWNILISLGKEHHLDFIVFLFSIYKKTYPIFKGHGIGLLIWIISKYIYKQN